MGEELFGGTHIYISDPINYTHTHTVIDVEFFLYMSVSLSYLMCVCVCVCVYTYVYASPTYPLLPNYQPLRSSLDQSTFLDR